MIGHQPENYAADVGNMATFVVSISAGTMPTYQWRTYEGGTWVNISGATSATYTTPAVQAGDDGTQFDVVITNNFGSVTSNTVTLYVGSVGWWKFDETNGTTASDSSGNGLTGTLQNGATWTNGIINGAVAFNGQNSYCEVPYTPSLDYLPGNDLTLSTWIWINPTETSGAGLIIRPWDGGGHYNYGLRLYADDTVGLCLKPIHARRSGRQVAKRLVDWNVALYRGTVVGSSNTMTLYVDGVAVASTVFSIADWQMPQIPDCPLAIGTVFPYGSGGWDYPRLSFDGKIDNTHIYSVALGPDEIAAQAGLTPAAPSVNITSPGSGVFTAPGAIAITANASETGGTIAKVDFYADGTLLGTDTSSPYYWIWNNPAPRALHADGCGHRQQRRNVDAIECHQCQRDSCCAHRAQCLRCLAQPNQSELDRPQRHHQRLQHLSQHDLRRRKLRLSINTGGLVATTSYNDTTASSGTTYYYTVEAVSARRAAARLQRSQRPDLSRRSDGP